jgi:hypothetical protein
MMRTTGVVVALTLSACALSAERAWLTALVDPPPVTGGPFGDPARALNGVRGGGMAMGSTDVYSLDYGENGSLVFDVGRALLDGPGAEIVIFENAFQIAGSDRRFMDQLVVSVSLDGETWVDFPHDYVAADESVYSSLPSDWPGFAGLSPVLLDVDTNPVDPFDGAAAGGDAFDLTDLPIEGVAAQIHDDGFRFVRVTAAATLTNPDTGETFPHDPGANGPDIDGIYVRGL